MSDKLIAALGGIIGGGLVALVFLFLYMRAEVHGRDRRR